MTATMPDSLLSSAARLRLPELLAIYEGSVHLSLALWDDLCKEALRTGSETLHSQRDMYESYFRGELERLDDCLGRLESNPTASPLRARWTALHDQLATKYAELFPKWQTLEDLEEILLAPFMLSKETVEALRAKSTFPQAWYDDDSNPFEPEPEEQTH